MADNLIQIKRTSVSGRVPTTSNLSTGELALNMADGIIYSSNGTVVFELGANNTNASVTGNLTVKTLIANNSIGTAGQMLLSNGTSDYWHSLFTPGSTPPASPIYGDIWYSTDDNKP